MEEFLLKLSYVDCYTNNSYKLEQKEINNLKVILIIREVNKINHN